MGVTIRMTVIPDKLIDLDKLEDLIVCLRAGSTSLLLKGQHIVYGKTKKEIFQTILQNDPEFNLYAEWIYMILDEIMEER